HFYDFLPVCPGVILKVPPRPAPPPFLPCLASSMYRLSLHVVTVTSLCSLWLAQITLAMPVVQMVGPPAISPDGTHVAFAWNGDLWSVPVEGGKLKQLTSHP